MGHCENGFRFGGKVQEVAGCVLEPWTNHLSALSLSFLLVKGGIIPPKAEMRMNYGKAAREFGMLLIHSVCQCMVA